MKRRVIAAGCLVLAAISMFSLIVVFRQDKAVEDKINPDSFEEIADGMSRADVEKLLGGPAGNYARRTNRLTGAITNFGQEYWRGTYYYIVIKFNAQDKVVMKFIYETEEAPPGYPDFRAPR